MEDTIVSAKIHPAIGIARVGNSPDAWFTGPETPGELISPGGFKDALGRIKRQAARFRVFGYDAHGKPVRELTAADARITWTVELGNTKASWHQFDSRFRDELPLRNAQVTGGDRKQLDILPGPRSLSAGEPFDPARHRFDSGCFFGKPVYLGELRADPHDPARLLVLGGHGVSGTSEPRYRYIRHYANNRGWHDDVSDGPVRATVTADGRELDVTPAWVIVAPPDFSPHTQNLVTAYDVALQAAVDGNMLAAPAGPWSFTRDVYPILRRVMGYPWLNERSAKGHGIGEAGDLFEPATFAALSQIADGNARARSRVFARLRSPEPRKSEANFRFMPQLSGDGGDVVQHDPERWQSVTPLQYRVLTDWANGQFVADWPDGANPYLGPPPAPAASPADAAHALDRAALEACVGGPFYPGIEITHIALHASLYSEPFRIAPAVGASDRPAGDITKWMAVPWQSDFFECYDHWWPAQRPDDVLPDAAFDRALVLRASTPNDTVDHFPDFLRERESWHRGLYDVVVRASAGGADVPDPDAPPGATKQDEGFWLHNRRGDLEMVDAWKDMGFVVRRTTPDDEFVAYVEQERAPYAGRMDLRTYFHLLLNIDAHRDFLPKAHELVRHFLDAAWERMHARDFAVARYRFFDYTPETFHDRLMDIYVSLQADGDAAEPQGDPKLTREAYVERTVQLAPFNQLDGAWLRNATQAGPIGTVNAYLFEIWSDEIGNGDPLLNHCNLYTQLLRSLGIALPDIRSREYAFNPRFLDSAFEIPVFELAISQFSQEFFPEILGMTLFLEWEVLGLRRTVKALEYLGIESQFYRMHIGIDNAVNGHGAKAKRAVELYLDEIRAREGSAGVQCAWKRIWTGYVAFATTGTIAADLGHFVSNPPSLDDSVSALIDSKREFAQYNHGRKQLGDNAINDWFADPDGFREELIASGMIVPGDPDDSPFFALLRFDGPMYKVFSADEIELWKSWTRWRGHRLPAKAPSVDLLMLHAVETLGNRARYEPAHARERLGPQPVAWWLRRPAREVMAALADSANGLVVPGNAAESAFVTSVLDQTNAMGRAWRAVSGPSRTQSAPRGQSYRQIAIAWIAAGCPLPHADARARSLPAGPAVVFDPDIGRVSAGTALVSGEPLGIAPADGGAQAATGAPPARTRTHRNPYGMSVVH